MESTTPDTMNYLLMGLAAITVLMGMSIGSIFLRHRNLDKDIETIKRLQQDD